jgi:hypothetical protein
VAEIVDFAKYKAELEAQKGSVGSFLRERGADNELAEFGEQLSKELVGLLDNLGQYNFPVTLPRSLSAEEQMQITADVNAGIGQVHGKLEAVIRTLVARTLIAELKVFQHERSHGNDL